MVDGLHVVLGATGGAGHAVARELASRGLRVRAVSRTGRGNLLPGTEHVRVNATNPAALQEACREASVVYHCVNVPYQFWAAQLLPIAEGIIEAAAAAGAKLIVMDNLYMYGRTPGPMTEATPRNAQGKKGHLRATLEARLFEAHRSGRVQVAIGRASDFYGPKANSAPMFLVVEPALRDKIVSWLGSLDAPHTLSYLPDVAWGLVTLAERNDALGEVWHLPAAEPLTGRQFIEMVSRELARPVKMRVLRRPVMLVGGLFSPLIREATETLYQFEHPFVMDASKFTRAFGTRTTPHQEAIRQTIAALRQ